MTGGHGADVVLEAVGTSTTVRTACALGSQRRNGCAWSVILHRRSRCHCRALSRRQIRLQGSCASAGRIPQAIELMASKVINVAPMLSAVAPLTEGRAGLSASMPTKQI